MPISKSAKKALSNAEAKASRNRWRKTVLKDALRGAAVVEGKSEPDAAASFSKAYSVVDKAVKWGIIHQNKAARIKSQLAKNVPVAAPKAVAKKTTPAKAVKPAVKAAKPVAKKTVKKIPTAKA